MLAPAPFVPRAPRTRAHPTAGVVSVPLADLRRRPDHASELVNQVLFGECVRVRRIAADRRWLEVASEEDGYAGWMRSWSLALGDASSALRWRLRARRIVDRPWLERPDAPGGALPFGARLARGRDGSLLGPLGELAVARAAHGTAALPPSGRGASGRGRLLVATARRFLGTAYHWGGRSFAGVDCSGLVQLVARRHGLVLPRDARQQCAAVGGVARLKPLAAVAAQGPRPGDLWFFGPNPRAVTHVAFSTGGLGLMHAYGSVRPGSLNPLSSQFEPELFRFVLGWQSLPNK